ncbi:sporulation integral membrane protein YlbJ [Thermoanaerobacter kivui]|uniref:Sporulation integral membrane protein YlbJ n=1 Tax=Thermoanaerobacter kivui TaxID=2325 RepID=A0A097ARW7_THEKI|nr:sporulation integral membrane protein YlbJ [Thermoanaerobacter kivui]AIS52570.1 sporulation integral membrane protein YlbJ [Thermoanaerobacter kivui]
MRNTLLNIFIALLILMVLSLIIFPKNALEAAKGGINLWLFTITPSLLPFFIGSELFLQLGVVHFLGTFLEPIMRPLFKVPGSGSFAMAIGYTSGYPVGAQIISRLWEEKLCTTEEAERLMSFCNNSGPLFMLGAVAIGMFNSPKIGYVIMASNYLAAITTGLLFHFYKKNSYTNSPPSKNLIKSAFDKMYHTRAQNKKSFSAILSDAVSKSMNTIIMIGGYIVFFSVIIEFLKLYKILDLLSYFISPLFSLIGFDKNVIPSFLSGLLEITVGSNLISQSPAPIEQKVILVSAIIAWGGVSIHGQVLSVIAKTKIKYFPYLIAKTLQFFLAAAYSYVILSFVKIQEENISINVFNQFSYKNAWNLFQNSSLIFTITTIIFIFFAIAARLHQHQT